jgi:putrescine transport system permease protein
MASALAVLMILLIIVPLALFQRYQAQSQESRR